MLRSSWPPRTRPEVSSEDRVALRVAKGEAEMGHSFTHILGSVDPRFHSIEAPFLYRNYRHLEGVFEGPLGQELLDAFGAQQMAGLSSTYSGGASGIATTDREVRRPEDLKGLKVGVFGNEINKAWLQSLGAIAVPIRHDLESIQKLAREGTIDAVVITWRNFERRALFRDFK